MSRPSSLWCLNRCNQCLALIRSVAVQDRFGLDGDRLNARVCDVARSVCAHSRLCVFLRLSLASSWLSVLHRKRFLAPQHSFYVARVSALTVHCPFSFQKHECSCHRCIGCQRRGTKGQILAYFVLSTPLPLTQSRSWFRMKRLTIMSIVFSAQCTPTP